MGTVFLSLYLLSVFLHFSGKLLGPESEYKKKAQKTAKTGKIEADKREVNLTGAEKKVSAKKAAAVTAAIYEILNNQKNYRIISIQKSNQN